VLHFDEKTETLSRDSAANKLLGLPPALRGAGKIMMDRFKKVWDS